MSFNAVDTSIFIESHKMWSVPVCLKAVSSVICAVGVIIQTCAVTCHADCIRLLAGRGMNICRKVWSLRTVIPIQCTTKTCCCSLETQGKSNIWCWICPLDYYFWFLDQWHNTCKVTNSATGIIQEPISAMKIVKTLPRWDKHIRVLWDYVKKYWHLREIIVLHFILLQLSFRLWVWHREPHLLNSLPYLFIVIYAVLFMIRS